VKKTTRAVSRKALLRRCSRLKAELARVTGVLEAPQPTNVQPPFVGTRDVEAGLAGGVPPNRAYFPSQEEWVRREEIVQARLKLILELPQLHHIESLRAGFQVSARTPGSWQEHMYFACCTALLMAQRERRA